MDGEGALAEVGVVGGAGPGVVGGAGDQLAADGVLVDVTDFLMEFLGGEDVAVVAGAGLPEVEGVVCGGLHSREKVGGVFQDVGAGFFGDGGFDGVEEGGDVGIGAERLEEEVDMFGHENVGDEAEGAGFLGGGEGLCEPAAGAGFGEEGLALIAGEGEVAVVGGRGAVVDAFARGGVGVGRGHGGRVLAGGLGGKKFL